MIAVGASTDPIEASSVQLLGQMKAIKGWPSGNPVDWEDTLNFCALTGVRAMIETLPLEKVSEGFERMMSNKVRFRAVLTH